LFAQTAPFPDSDNASDLDPSRTVALSRALTVPFPRAPTGSPDAAAQFDSRANAVIDYNACGREEDYTTIRNEMNAGNFQYEKAELLAILIGKVAWLNRGFNDYSPPCTKSIPTPPTPAPVTATVPPLPNPILTPQHIQTALIAMLDRGTGTSCDKVDLTTDSQNVLVVVSASCMRTEVNEAIRAMIKDQQMGTDGLPCLENTVNDVLTLGQAGGGMPGNWDFVERDLSRILYLGVQTGGGQGSTVPSHAPVLLPETITFMEQNLLSASGATSPDAYSMIEGCNDPAGDQLGTPEDIQDGNDFGQKVVDATSDAFKWFLNLIVTALSTAALSNVGLAWVPLAVDLLNTLSGNPLDAAPGINLTVGETENHLLMIESSRYLENQYYISQLQSQGIDASKYQGWQAGVRSWLLDRLNRIAKEDFLEYNAKPYGELSIDAITNLYDFAQDPAIATASRIVLDLSEAKFAAGSNRGRRIVPYRRKVEYEDVSDGYSLYNCFARADNEIGRSFVLSGQTQLVPVPPGVPAVAPGTSLNSICLGGLLYVATGKYRLPGVLLAAEVERADTAQQWIHNAGAELYAQSPSFTISAGGELVVPYSYFIIDTPPLNKNDDYGIAMPTMIIPTASAATVGETFHFSGVGTQKDRTQNLCVTQGFACGVAPFIPAGYTSQTNLPLSPGYYSGTSCPADNDACNFFFAARIEACDGSFCDKGVNFGIMEFVEASLYRNSGGFDAFNEVARSHMGGIHPDSSGNATYVTSASRTIHFSLNQSFPQIRDVNGIAVPALDAPSYGNLIDSDGAGHINIGRTMNNIRIDVSDPNNPQRVEE
ncbi:MAG: hypothetical protein ABJC66_14680, partial [Gammaproteobacteria bacterium]